MLALALALYSRPTSSSARPCGGAVLGLIFVAMRALPCHPRLKKHDLAVEVELAALTAAEGACALQHRWLDADADPREYVGDG